jgi:type IV pilus assembly protein PilX
MKPMITLKRRRQSGAVLIVTMIILVVLTLLGVTAMNTSSLEERIAANTQASVHAFQAAETGYSRAFQDQAVYKLSAYDLTGSYTGEEAQTAFAGTQDSAGYVATFMGFAPPVPGSGYSAINFQAAHFNFRSTGQSGSGLTAILNGGAYQMAPKM